MHTGISYHAIMYNVHPLTGCRLCSDQDVLGQRTYDRVGEGEREREREREEKEKLLLKS